MIIDPAFVGLVERLSARQLDHLPFDQEPVPAVPKVEADDTEQIGQAGLLRLVK